MSDNEDISGPRPRLCHLRKWAHFQGYGFNLHAEKTRNGQSIGKVDPNSPAESAGLKEKDRIIEVNYVNISNENHQQVVKRIRNGLEINGQLIENEVVLLVVDPEADEYYKKKNIVVKHDFKNVLRQETPSESELNNNNNNNKTNTFNTSNDTKLLPPDSSPQVSSHRNSVSSTSEHNNSATEINNNTFEKATNDHRFNTSQNEKVSTPLIQERNSSHYEKPSPPQTPLSTKSNGSVASSNNDAQSNRSATNNNNNNNIPNNKNDSNSSNSSSDPFKMSAAEFKNFLKNNKQKSDPRNVHVDIKQKFQIFQNM